MQLVADGKRAVSCRKSPRRFEISAARIPERKTCHKDFPVKKIWQSANIISRGPFTENIKCKFERLGFPALVLRLSSPRPQKRGTRQTKLTSTLSNGRQLSCRLLLGDSNCRREVSTVRLHERTVSESQRS